MNNQNNLKNKSERNSKKLRSFGAICEGIHAKLARNPGTRNFVGFAAVVVLVCVVWSFATDNATVAPREFSPKEVLTTTREIRMNTRDFRESYPPEANLDLVGGNTSHKNDRKVGSTVIVPEDIMGEIVEEVNGKVTRTNKVMLPKGPSNQKTASNNLKYKRGQITYPVGTPVRILKLMPGKTAAWILIGPTNEQCIVSVEAILEAGGTPGKQIFGSSKQYPPAISTINWQGPEGIWTGIATGDENIPSTNPYWEKEVFRLINQERTNRGLSILTWDEDLARAARYQAGDTYTQNYTFGGMIGDPRMAHASGDTVYDYYVKDEDKDPSGADNDIPKIQVFKAETKLLETMAERIQRFSPKAYFEISVGHHATTSPQISMQEWMASPGHRKAILNPTLRTMGCGYVGRVGEPTTGPRAGGGNGVTVFGR